MGGNDILLDRLITGEELLNHLAALLQVSEDDIYIPSYTPDRVSVDKQHAKVVADITDIGPNFPTKLFIVTDTNLLNPEDPKFVQALCNRLNCRALMEPLAPPEDQGTDSIHWLVTPDGLLYRVVVESTPLDADPPQFIIDESHEKQLITRMNSVKP